MLTKEHADAVIKAVKGYLERSIQVFSSRLDDLEKSIKSLPVPVNGTNGVDGRDALNLEILPTIDETKNYPRGTYAQFKGGLWRSHETTYGMRGWSCIVEGLNSVNVEQIDERNFSIKLERSGGFIEEKNFLIPVVLDKGVFKEGTVYEKSDACTFGGSFWIAQEKTAGKPGIDKTWRLAVKRGRDGAAGKDGKEGPQGRSGAHGKDLTQLGPNGSKW